jgi:hypothetical protein
MSEKTENFFDKHYTKIYVTAALLCLASAIFGYFLTNNIIIEVKSHAPRIMADGSTLSMVFMAGLIPIFVVLEVLYRLEILRLSDKISMLILIALMAAPSLLMQDLFFERVQVWMITNGYERCEAFDHHSNGTGRNNASHSSAWVQRGACEKYGQD